MFYKKKGKYGYLKSAKIQTLIYTIILFALALSVFFIGVTVTGTNANLFSIISVLGLLPACKSLVSLIMFAKAKVCPEEYYNKISEVGYPGTIMYELQITAYERAYQVDAIAACGHLIIGVSSDKKLKYADLEKHIRNILGQNGHKDYSVKIFEDLDKYTNRLKALADNDEGFSDNTEILQLIKDMAL